MDIQPLNFSELQKGECVPADYSIERLKQIPEWFDAVKFEKAKLIFKKYSFSLLFGHLLGLIFLVFIPTVLKTLKHTGKSSSNVLLLRRYLGTLREICSWYEDDIWNSDSKAHKSIIKVRQKHQKASTSQIHKSECSRTVRTVPISQYDLSITQFAFVSFAVLYPEKIGLKLTENDTECFLHFWRTIGYLLGIEDRFNLCGGDQVFQTKLLCEEILNQAFEPALSNYREESVIMSNGIIESLCSFLFILRWRAIMSYHLEHMKMPIWFTMDPLDYLGLYLGKFLFDVLLQFSVVREFFNWLLARRIRIAVENRKFYEDVLRTKCCFGFE